MVAGEAVPVATETPQQEEEQHSGREYAIAILPLFPQKGEDARDEKEEAEQDEERGLLSDEHSQQPPKQYKQSLKLASLSAKDAMDVDEEAMKKEEGEDEEEMEMRKWWLTKGGWKKARMELWLLLRLSLPLLVADTARYIMFITDTAFLGHLGRTEMAAAALGGVWADCTLYFGVGFVMAMDTLVAQAEGAKNHRMIGLTFGVSILFNFLVSLPIGLAWWFADVALIIGGIPENIALLAASFARYQILGLFPHLVYRAIIRYLLGQEITMPSIVTNWIGVAANFGLNWILIKGGFGWSGLGFIGAPLATSLSRILCPILLWGYVVLRGYHKKTWQGWTIRDVFEPKLVWTYAKLGLAGGFTLAFEVSGYQVITFLAGKLGEEVIDAHVVAQQVLWISFLIPLTLNLGAATRVGKYMGENKPSEARFISFICLAFTAVAMLFNGSVMVLARHWLVLIFTSDPAITSLAATLILWAAAITFFDGQVVVSGGIMRGIGKPLPGTILTFVGYYVVSLIIGTLLAFKTDCGWLV
ncbi:hypothetical protein QOT17_025016 [Balamuthia mandrillaris]